MKSQLSKAKSPLAKGTECPPCATPFEICLIDHPWFSTVAFFIIVTVQVATRNNLGVKGKRTTVTPVYGNQEVDEYADFKSLVVEATASGLKVVSVQRGSRVYDAPKEIEIVELRKRLRGVERKAGCIYYKSSQEADFKEELKVWHAETGPIPLKAASSPKPKASAAPPAKQKLKASGAAEASAAPGAEEKSKGAGAPASPTSEAMCEKIEALYAKLEAALEKRCETAEAELNDLRAEYTEAKAKANQLEQKLARAAQAYATEKYETGLELRVLKIERKRKLEKVRKASAGGDTKSVATVGASPTVESGGGKLVPLAGEKRKADAAAAVVAKKTNPSQQALGQGSESRAGDKRKAGDAPAEEVPQKTRKGVAGNPIVVADDE